MYYQMDAGARFPVEFKFEFEFEFEFELKLELEFEAESELELFPSGRSSETLPSLY